MSRYLILIAAIALAGCDNDMNGWVPGSDAVSPAAAAVDPPVAPEHGQTLVAARDDPYCRGVAHQRMLDAKTFGYDKDMLSAIFDGAYDNCEAWRVRDPQ